MRPTTGSDLELVPVRIAAVRELVAGPIREAILIPNKSARQERLDQVLSETIAKLKSDEPNRDRHEDEMVDAGGRELKP